MEILIYHGKHGKQYWVVDTPARMDGAMRALFQQLDDWHCYLDPLEADEWLTAARAGDIRCIKAILESHNGYEYETWEIDFADIVE